MRQALNGAGLGLALVLLGGLALLILLRSTSKLLDWLPLSRGGTSRTRKWLPVASTAIVLLYLVAAVQWLLLDVADTGWVPTLVLLLIVAAGWQAVRDGMDGLFLRATGACRVGDYVQLKDFEGRVRSLGWRFLTLETSEGHVATIPYGEVVGGALRRLPEVKHGLLHLFRVLPPDGVSVPQAKRRIQRAALLCPWCVPKRNARVKALVQGNELEVTLSLVDADHAAEAEEVIRTALAELSPDAHRGSVPKSAERRSSHPPTTRTSISPTARASYPPR